MVGKQYKTWLYAGKSEYAAVLTKICIITYNVSNKPTAADNQQETFFILGFLRDYTPCPCECRVMI